MGRSKSNDKSSNSGKGKGNYKSNDKGKRRGFFASLRMTIIFGWSKLLFADQDYPKLLWLTKPIQATVR
jgi:hypothetical protein